MLIKIVMIHTVRMVQTNRASGSHWVLVLAIFSSWEVKVGTALGSHYGEQPAVLCQLSEMEQYLSGFVLGELPERTALKNEKSVEKGL